MFKPGDLVSFRDRPGTVVSVDSDYNIEIQLDTLTIKCAEDEARMAHPSVLLGASGVDTFYEARNARTTQIRESLVPSNPDEDYERLSKLAAKIEDRVRKILTTVGIDFNGHFVNGSMLRPEFKRDLSKEIWVMYTGLQGRPDLWHAFDNHNEENSESTDNRTWVNISFAFRLYRLTCPCCGSRVDSSIETNGVNIRVAGDACPFAQGLPPTEWELNVPSGKLVVANDLRNLFPLPADGDFDINTSWGCRQTALAYAEQGLSHAFVGNSCPSVYRTHKDIRFKIACLRKQKKSKKVAGITTDLWWYSLCDLNEFRLREKYFSIEMDSRFYQVIDVKPGVYRFEHDELACRNEDYESDTVFTTFEWVRDPDPKTDFLALYNEVEVNAYAYVRRCVENYPMLYGSMSDDDIFGEKALSWENMTPEQRVNAWQRVADHTLLTIGNGIDWHEKGFPLAQVDKSIADIEPPEFRQQYHWYGLHSDYSAIFCQPKLSPSFAKLAFRLLESIISFGTKPRDDSTCRHIDTARKEMMLAVQIYRELGNKYPDLADPEYIKWLSCEGRAERWVINFDLGPQITEKHLKMMESAKWMPEDVYAVEVDFSKLDPKKLRETYRASNGEYGLMFAENDMSIGDRNAFWGGGTRYAVPERFIARIKSPFEYSHMGEGIVELEFDYGNEHMLNPAIRLGLRKAWKDAVTYLSKEEYNELLSSLPR